MKVTVLGTGYVGLVAGACFSDSGNHVTCVDVDNDKVERLRQGHVPFYEPGLEDLVARNTKAGRLLFTTDSKQAIAEAQIVFVAVGTPQGDDGSSNLSYVLEAVRTVRDSVTRGILLVMKSTVPVGTADRVRQEIQGSKYPIEVISNPEFLKEGAAINDFLRPERVVIGTDSLEARAMMADLYAPYVRNGSPILFMSNRSAELTKYAANTFLAMKISFINEMAVLSERVGANIHDVRKGIITDSRIGSKFLYPGCGYGGSCFPKDVLALIHLGREIEMPLRLFEEVHAVNERQKQLLYEKIDRHFGGSLEGKTIAVWGLSFKPETDDMREAPAVTLINALLEKKVKIRAYDPIANKEARRIFENKVELFEDAYETTRSADALAILTEWNEFRSPDFDTLRRDLKGSAIFDGRNLYNPESLEGMGFSYYCIGKRDPILGQS
ncbi:UDP-glucose/GDP-mannose dehydrogenase family protein [bacterium]|nr:UDP-glucose/GDP-mannose dehydrogenase family protein [bacterium]